MSLELRLALKGELKPYLEERERGLEIGAMEGARRGRDLLKNRLRDDTRAGGLGDRVANTWRGQVYPSQGTSLSPAAIVYSKAAHIARAFNEGATIRSHDGFWLAIPSDNVPDSLIRGNRGRGRLTPGILEQKLGIKLRFVPVFKAGARGRFALLVADQVRTKKGKRGGFAKASARAIAKGQGESVVMFVLVPQATLKKRLHVDAIEAQMRSEWPAIYQGALNDAAEEAERKFGG